MLNCDIIEFVYPNYLKNIICHGGINIQNSSQLFITAVFSKKKQQPPLL